MTKIAVFLTTERAAAVELLAACCRRWPEATLVAFANDDDRAALQATAPGVEFRRDKPPGGKVAFVRALRAERFDRAVAAWHGGERLQPLRVVAALLGCPVVVFDERGRETEFGWWQPWRWAPHSVRRAMRTDALQLARAAAAVWRATFGLVISFVWLPIRLRIPRRSR